MNPTSQRALILEHLKRVGFITPMEALVKIGCFRLGARIYDLRREGWPISTDRDPEKKFAIYRLAKEGAQ